MTDTLIDPQDKYHADGFAEQPQDWPGLQRDMDPVPDCGEQSYRGTGRLKGRRAPIKAALLDQRTVAGLGNIYVCEALYRAGISPNRLAASVAGPQRSERLARAIRDVLGDAIAAGGSTLRDYAQTDGELGYFQHSFAVYDRDGVACSKSGCGGTVKRTVQSGRSTYYCPQCQR